MILSFATENYKNYVNLFINSLLLNSPKSNCSIFCVGWKPRIKNIENIKFIEYPINKTIENEIEKNNRSGELLRLKPKLILEEYIKTEDPILWIDIDSIINKKLYMYFKKLENKDFLCTYRPRQKSYAKFAVAVLGFSRTDNAKKLLINYKEIAETCEGINGWFQDQISLWKAYRNNKNCRLYDLNNNFHSINGKTDSIIISKRKNFNYIQMRKFLKSKVKLREYV